MLAGNLNGKLLQVPSAK